MSKEKSSDLRKKGKKDYMTGSVNVDPVIVYAVQCCTLPGSTEIHSTCSPSRIEGHFVELHFVFVRHIFQNFFNVSIGHSLMKN